MAEQRYSSPTQAQPAGRVKAVEILSLQSRLASSVSSPPSSLLTIDKGAHCGKRIRVYYGDVKVNFKVVDQCVSCAETDLQLSKAAYHALFDSQYEGVLFIGWHFN